MKTSLSGKTDIHFHRLDFVLWEGKVRTTWKKIRTRNRGKKVLLWCLENSKRQQEHRVEVEEGPTTRAFDNKGKTSRLLTTSVEKVYRGRNTKVL